MITGAGAASRVVGVDRSEPEASPQPATDSVNVEGEREKARRRVPSRSLLGISSFDDPSDS